MRALFSPISTLVPALVAMLLVGCSSSTPALQNPAVPSVVGQATTPSEPIAEETPLPQNFLRSALPGWRSPAAQRKNGRLLYASLEGAGEILIYSESAINQAPIGMITSGLSQPWGLYVDKSGNLYVANLNSTVSVYPPGAVTPSLTYSQDLCHPLFTIVDARGNVFVANGRSCGTGPATVVEYAAGSTNADRTLPLPATELDGIDFDRQGNLYVAFRATLKRGHGSIAKFPPGSTKGTILGMLVHKPQGLIVDNEGNILVAETSKTSRDIVVYAPGARFPSARVKLPMGSIPNGIAITEKEHKLFVTSYNNGTVYVTHYPLGKASTWTEIENPGDDVQGVAVSNDQVF